MSVKELTGLSLTDLWKEYQSSFRDFWQVSDEGMKVMRKTLIEEALKAEQWQYIGCSEMRGMFQGQITGMGTGRGGSY